MKLDRPRRIAFINKELKITAAEAKYYWIKGITIFAFAGSLGSILFFVPIGLILFLFPRLNTASPALISSYALAVLYMINPITEITSSLPQIAQANVALKKIDSLGLSLTESVIESDFPTGSDFDDNWTSWEIDFVDVNSIMESLNYLKQSKSNY